MNTIKDLLRDLALEAQNKLQELEEKDKYLVGITEITEDLVEEYYERFIKEISKYFEMEGA